MNYRMMAEKDLECVVERNIEYYNTVENCCWTFEKAYKRIHQVLTMEDSMWYKIPMKAGLSLFLMSEKMHLFRRSSGIIQSKELL